MAAVTGLPKLNAELIESALIGSHRDVQRLLDERADVYAMDRDGYTALSEAASAGHTVVVGQLLRALSDPNQQAKDGRTALHRSAFQGWLPVVQLLLENGADPAMSDEQGKTPSELARNGNVKAALQDFPSDQTKELMQALQKKLPARPRAAEVEKVAPEVLTAVATPQQPPRTRRFDVQSSTKSSEPAPAQEPAVVEAVVEVEGDKDQERADAAKQWLETVEGSAELPCTWNDVMAAKAAAQDLFVKGSLTQARQATTVAIQALRKLLANDGELLANAVPISQAKSQLGLLHSNRALILMRQSENSAEEIVGLGPEMGWHLVISDADAALTLDQSNFKASFRRAKALYELGELDEALIDATKVVEHYEKASESPNPEAANLRLQIQEDLKRERAKFGQRGGSSWNRSGGRF
mmetsp:Transcript_44603/g.105758  ORF Transcript_44603/g.105758 Transcript_44603/m.105758 type:complete len:412 (+) Transcript_44603:84-1319(+)